jgi:hypothetical protein
MLSTNRLSPVVFHWPFCPSQGPDLCQSLTAQLQFLWREILGLPRSEPGKLPHEKRHRDINGFVAGRAVESQSCVAHNVPSE